MKAHHQTNEPEAEVKLKEALQELVPEVELSWQRIPRTSWHGLFLDEELATRPLPPVTAERVMNEPPFWSLLWPAGNKLCQLLKRWPELAEGREWVDLGCGSGIVSVALCAAGATVQAFDTDPLSCLATKVNCQANQVECEVGTWWEVKPCDSLLLADFLYDESNLAGLAAFKGVSREIVVVDSRLKELPDPDFQFLGQCEGLAVPDLDPHGEFGCLKAWYYGERFQSWKNAF